MVLLAILIVFVLLQLWGSGGPIQRDQWYAEWRDNLSNWLKLTPGSGVHLMLSVLVPVAAVLFLESVIRQSLWGLMDLLLLVLILLYSLGRGDLSQDVADYLERWERGDTEAILDSLVEAGEELPTMDSAADVHREARRRLYTRGFERLFAVLFWFVVAGPAGALMYRLVRLYQPVTMAGLRDQALHLLDWVPVRLAAAGFALVRDFERGARALNERIWQTDAQVADILQHCGNAALNIVDVDGQDMAAGAGQLDARHQIEAIQELYRLSWMLWVVVIGVLVILI